MTDSETVDDVEADPAGENSSVDGPGGASSGPGDSVHLPPGRQYEESVVITKVVRLVAPFVFVFGLFVMFHGASSAGGGFQGGVVVASVIVTIAFAFGIDQTGVWLDRRLLTGLAVVGVVVFALLGVGSFVFGGSFLDFTAYPGAKAALYAIEIVELGIGVTVAATIVVFFFEIAGGFDAVASDRDPDDRTEDTGDTGTGGESG